MFKQAKAKPSMTDSKAIQQQKRRAAWQVMLQDSCARAASRVSYRATAY